MGARDVVLVEKSGLTQGATWHAAGLVGQLRSSRNVTRMLQLSVELYGRLEEETGQAVDWKQVGSLRLAYAQFEELEAFARFGTRLDDATRRTLARGHAVREILKQPQYQPMPAAEQVAVLLAVNEGVFDNVPEDDVPPAQTRLRRAVVEQLADVCERIESGQKLSDDDRAALLRVARNAIAPQVNHGEADDADA